jgi:hypothetical protein
MSDMTRVLARTTDGRYVTHPTLASTDSGKVYRQWQVLDQARQDGRLPLVQYLVIRDAADPDPRWAGAADDLGPFFVGRLRGTTDRTAAAKRLGQRVGFVGRGGGWVYQAGERLGRRRAVCQGWKTLVHRQGWERRGLLVCALDTRTEGPLRAFRYYLNDLLDV